MPQLLVRNLEEELVDRLKKRAGEPGVSTEEEHRRILRATLFDDEAKKIGMTFKEHLLAMPDLDDDSIFERDRTLNGRGCDPHLFEA
jgi:plasmid stability protein